jgi:GNAT superfamily N-acetyltransferase
VDFPPQISVGPKTLTLVELYVDAPYIRKGYGTQLWNHAVGLARKQGYREILFRAELKAHNFYRRMGAKLIQEYDFGTYPNGSLYSAPSVMRRAYL